MMRHHALHASFSFFLLSVSVSIFLYFFFLYYRWRRWRCWSSVLQFYSTRIDEHIARNYSLLRHWVFTRRWFFLSSEYVISSLALMQSHWNRWENFNFHLNTDSIFIDAFKLILHSSFYLSSSSIVHPIQWQKREKKCSSNFSLGNWLSILEWHGIVDCNKDP